MAKFESRHDEMVGSREAGDALRRVIAAEYVEKLPPSMSFPDFARFAGVSVTQLRRSVSRGEVVASIAGGNRRILPADNTSYLSRSQLRHLALTPKQVQALSTRSLQREVSVTAETFETLWEKAIDASLTPGELIDRFLRD